MRHPWLPTIVAMSVAPCVLTGCRNAPPLRPTAAPPEGPGGLPAEASAPLDLTAALSPTWSVTAVPSGEATPDGHADFDLTAKLDLRNTSRASVQAGRQGYVILGAPNLEIAPLTAPEFGGFSVNAGAVRTLSWENHYRARVQGRKLYLRELWPQIACTAPLAVAGGQGERVVVVGRFERKAPGAERKQDIWPYDTGFLRAKADGRDEWAARLAKKLLEDKAAERG